MVPHDARLGQGGVLETHLVVNIVQPLVALLLERIVRNGIKGGAGHRHISGVGGKFQIALLLGEPAQEHGGGSTGGGAAILLVGGAAVAGLVGYGVYSYVSEQQLKALLPEGVAMPENRAQTALLLWNTAGRPEPAEAPAFKDVADPDTAKAAQWCVEHGLMDQKLGGRFAPDNSDPSYKTLNAYQQLVG